MAKISSVKAREILDSRGNPTVEVSYKYIICVVWYKRVFLCLYVYDVLFIRYDFNSQTIASSSFYLP